MSDYGKRLLKQTQNGLIGRCKIAVDGQEFEMPKNLLTAQSDVFEAMFMSSAVESQTGVVHIKDMRAEVFQALFSYIHIGKLDGFEDFVPDLFIVSDRYQIQQLRNDCIDYLINTLNHENFVNNVILALDYNGDELLTKIINAVTSKPSNLFSRVLESNGWQQFRAENPDDARKVMTTIFDTVHFEC